MNSRRVAYNQTFRWAAAMLLAGSVGTRSGVLAEPQPIRGKIDYRRDVQPILSEFCLTCHGPDSGKRQAGLRLDIREEALKRLESGVRAIVPGEAHSSELVRRIRAGDDERMPRAKRASGFPTTSSGFWSSGSTTELIMRSTGRL